MSVIFAQRDVGLPSHSNRQTFLLTVLREIQMYRVGRTSNCFVFDEVGKLEHMDLDKNDKMSMFSYLKKFSNKHGIEVSEFACIDSKDDDTELLRKTGEGVVFV